MRLFPPLLTFSTLAAALASFALLIAVPPAVDSTQTTVNTHLPGHPQEMATEIES